MKHLVVNDGEHMTARQVDWLQWRLAALVRNEDWERAGKIADQILNLVMEQPCPGH